jgi:3-hydroxy-3-methylglutaryl CoA synthase
VGEHRLTARLDPADSIARPMSALALRLPIEPKVLVIAADVSGDERVISRRAAGAGATAFAVETSLPVRSPRAS